MSRRTYVYTQGGRPLPEPIEVGEGYVDTSNERQPVYTDRYMEGVRAVDGTDISSRAKRRAYMQAHGLADTSDFTQSWAKAAADRERALSTQHDTSARREALARAYEQRRGKR